MCNLYTERLSAAEVAAHFGVANPIQSNAGEEVYPGAEGMVVREDDGHRIIEIMKWGFPRHSKNKRTGLPNKPQPVNNIADLDNFMWRGIAPRPFHRCIIPLTGFAEAAGPDGRKTRTWFTHKEQPLFAWAGMWRNSDEWGPVYSGLMTSANDAIKPLHDRMPVLLDPDDYDQWLHGSLDDVLAFRNRIYPPAVIAMTPTDELWIRRKAAAAPSLI